jgi:hypothetical protein
MPILAGVVSTLSLIIGLTGVSTPDRLREASRALRVGGWALVGLSVVLALTAAIPSGLTGGSSDFTRPDPTSVCAAGSCPVFVHPAGSDSPLGPTGYLTGSASGAGSGQ